MMRHLLVCLPLPTAAQTKSEHFTFAERQALRFGTDAMSRTTLILVTFVLATGCGDSGNPVGPSPTPVLVPIDVRPVDSRFNEAAVRLQSA